METSPSRHPVVDLCGVYFDVDGWESYLRTFADLTPAYLRTFGQALSGLAGLDAAAYLGAFERDPHKAVDALLEAGGLDVKPADHVEALRAQGVAHQVIHGGHGRLADGSSINDRQAQIAAAHPDLLSAWAGLDLTDVDAGLAELEHCAVDLGMRGASIVHWWGGRPPRDPGCHRVYTRAAELGVALWIHTGMNYAANRPFDFCDWGDIDHIAVAHPDLTIIAGHGGWPWILEGMAVLQRHRNVYLEFSAHRPRHMAKPGSGWEPMLNLGRTLLRDKILFGSVTWVHTVDIAQLAQDVVELNLGEDTTAAWLHDNGARLLGLGA